MIIDQQMKLISDTIDINDRALAYGDGIFETIAFVNGQLHNWCAHWQRLSLGAARLCLSLPDEQLLLGLIHEKLLQDCQQEQLAKCDSRIVKIILSRGSGGRGYQFPQPQRESLLITLHAWPERPISDYLSGINVLLCQTCLAAQPALVGIKHLNRLEQVLARNEFDSDLYHDGLLLSCSEPFDNSKGYLIEATSSNVFFVKEGHLFTPQIDYCGVSGTMRQAIIQQAQRLDIPLQQGHYRLSELLQAKEIFLTNSIYGILPLASLTIDAEIRWQSEPSSVEPGIASRLSKIINPVLNRPELL